MIKKILLCVLVIFSSSTHSFQGLIMHVPDSPSLWNTLNELETLITPCQLLLIKKTVAMALLNTAIIDAQTEVAWNRWSCIRILGISIYALNLYYGASRFDQFCPPGIIAV